MHKLKFDIYIGIKTKLGQSENIVAVITPRFYVPKGKCNSKGSESQHEDSYYFDKLYDACTYFADWIDLLNEPTLLQATIFLNKLSLHKTFNGNAIIDCIEKIDQPPAYLEIHSFNDLNS